MRNLVAIFSMLCLTATHILEPTESESLPCLIFFYGPPGSGKDSFTAMIRQEFGLPSIHPGDSNLLKSFEQNDADDADDADSSVMLDLSSVPNDLLPTLLCRRLQDADCSKGALIEDLELTIEQLAEIYKKFATKFQCLAVSIDIDETVLLKQTKHRMFCKSCGAIYTFQDEKPHSCHYCRKPLAIRHDDQPQVIRGKLADYTKRFQQSIDFFKERNLLSEIKAAQNFFENENTVRCLIQLKTHIKPNKDNPLPSKLKFWHQTTAG